MGHQQEKGNSRRQARINYFITLMAEAAVGGTRVPLTLKQSLSYRVQPATEFFADGELLQEWECRVDPSPCKEWRPLPFFPKWQTLLKFSISNSSNSASAHMRLPAAGSTHRHTCRFQPLTAGCGAQTCRTHPGLYPADREYAIPERVWARPDTRSPRAPKNAPSDGTQPRRPSQKPSVNP